MYTGTAYSGCMLSGCLEDWLKTMEKLENWHLIVVVVVYERFQLKWFDWENCGSLDWWLLEGLTVCVL